MCKVMFTKILRLHVYSGQFLPCTCVHFMIKIEQNKTNKQKKAGEFFTDQQAAACTRLPPPSQLCTASSETTSPLIHCEFNLDLWIAYCCQVLTDIIWQCGVNYQFCAKFFNGAYTVHLHMSVSFSGLIYRQIQINVSTIALSDRKNRGHCAIFMLVNKVSNLSLCCESTQKLYF